MIGCDIEARVQKLTFKRRHTDECQKKLSIREWDQVQDKRKRCSCPYWIVGVLYDGKGFQRKATGETAEERAKDVVRHWLNQGNTTTRPEDGKHTAVSTAIAEFLQYTKDGGAEKSTLVKYRTLMDQLQAFADWKGFRFVQELNQDAVLEFRRSWEDSDAGYKMGRTNSRGRKLWTRVTEGTAKRHAKTLRGFFELCILRKWTSENPTVILRFPKSAYGGRKKKEDVKYLNQNQWTDIIWAVDKFERMPEENRMRLKGLMMLMRHSGLRLSDAVTLTADKIHGDVLKLETKKASTDVQIPLPPEAIQAIRALKPNEGGFLFWNRQSVESDPRTPVLYYTTALQKVFRIAGVKEKGDGKLSHMFRNTFAVCLLEKGVPLETVSLMLGHQSVTTTERYYADFSQGYMDRAEAAIRATWSLQPGETLGYARPL